MCNNLTEEQLGSPYACCIECDFLQQTLFIPDGECQDVEWSGNLFEMNNDLCECGCQDSVNPADGLYRAVATAFSDIYTYNSWDTEMDTPEHAVLMDFAQEAGAFHATTVEFNIPTDMSLIEIEVGNVDMPCTHDYDCAADEYCDSCAHGSCPACDDCVAACSLHQCYNEPNLECDGIKPDCDPGQTAVIVDGCWECSCDRHQ